MSHDTIFNNQTTLCQQKAFVMTQHIGLCYVSKALSATLCQQNLISPHKYLMMTLQKYAVLAKKIDKSAK